MPPVVLVVKATKTITALHRAVRQRDHVGRFAGPALPELLVGGDKVVRTRVRVRQMHSRPPEKMLLPHLIKTEEVRQRR
jgi:hypothetical protein